MRSQSLALSIVPFSLLALAGCAAQGEGRTLAPVPTDEVAHARSLADAAVPPPRDAAMAGPVRETSAPPVSPSLLALRDGERVVLSDPDTDRLYVVGLDTRTVQQTIDLERGVEPGRLVEDSLGRVHAVLRRGGGIVTLEPGADTVTRRATCAAPRGIDYHAADDTLLVACAEGELVMLPAAGGDVTRRIALDDDLRDVVALDERVLVSRFRSAQVIALDYDSGAVVAHYVPATVERIDPLVRSLEESAPAMATFAPEVAWRMIRVGSGVWLLHQRARTTAIPLVAGGISYGAPSADSGANCTFGLVESSVSRIEPDEESGELDPSRPMTTVLATDVVVAPSDPDEVVVPMDPPAVADLGPCSRITAETLASAGGAVAAVPGHGVVRAEGHPLAISWLEGGERTTVSLTAERDWSDADVGRAVFQTVQPSRIACASCHPEGGDDGHVWTQGMGVGLRTQTMQGQILATAPFHWEGDMPNFAILVNEVLVGRMRGAPLHPARGAAFAAWVDGLEPPPRPATDTDAIARGQALFESADHGCTGCHRGASFSTGDTVDVGTGGAFQVPSLIGVAYRAPYMHTGCARTLRERFTASASCNGGDSHGHVSDLTQTEIDDLVAYLRSL